MPTTIMPCNCQDKFQDETYGKGMRLHNISGTAQVAYCTVCSPSQLTRKFHKQATNQELPKKGKPILRGLSLSK